MANATVDSKVEIILQEKVRYLHIDRFLYSKHSDGALTENLLAMQRRKRECRARAQLQLIVDIH